MKKFFGVLLFIGFQLCNLTLTGCGGSSGGGSATANVAVQLTKTGIPATAYSVSQMTITIQKSGGAPLTGVTGTNGIANISVSETGTYQVIKVEGRDVTGLTEASEGREFIKDSPITSAAPLSTYTPGVSPTVSVTALNGGTVSVNIPVPDIRKVTLIKKQSVNAGGNDNPHYSISQAAPFPGRIVLNNIHFSNNDGISVWGPHYHFTFEVTEGLGKISPILYNPGSNTLSDIAATTWPYPVPIFLEVPSANDWAISNGSTNLTKGASGPSFELLNNTSILDIYNFGVTHTPAGTNALDYEIQSFETL